ncbi:MAG: type II secretion system protein GspM [Halioglobus sp.]
MNWIRSHKRSASIVGLTLLVPVFLYLNALFGLLGMRHNYQSEIDGLEPRIARMQGLLQHEQQLGEAAAKVDKQVVNLVYAATADRATVSAALQTDVRQILVDAGLSISNSQVMPVREKEAFDYISVKLTVTGSLASLDAALITLAGYMPLVLVESLEVWSARASRRNKVSKEQTINATLQLLSLRAAQ